MCTTVFPVYLSSLILKRIKSQNLGGRLSKFLVLRNTQAQAVCGMHVSIKRSSQDVVKKATTCMPTQSLLFLSVSVKEQEPQIYRFQILSINSCKITAPNHRTRKAPEKALSRNFGLPKISVRGPKFSVPGPNFAIGPPSEKKVTCSYHS